jgi:hypothetical protein
MKHAFELIIFGPMCPSSFFFNKKVLLFYIWVKNNWEKKSLNPIKFINRFVGLTCSSTSFKLLSVFLFNTFLSLDLKKSISSYVIDDFFSYSSKLKKKKNTISFSIINDLLLLSQPHTSSMVLSPFKKYFIKKTYVFY